MQRTVNPSPKGYAGSNPARRTFFFEVSTLVMTKHMLQTLVDNAYKAIEEGVYAIVMQMEKSQEDIVHTIKTNQHPTLITEIKFASPAKGTLREVSNPVAIAEQMVAGGAKALSVLTQPHLFNGSPDIFIQVREAVDVPLLMKDFIVDTVQIDAAANMGADIILLIQSLFDKGYVSDIDAYIQYAHSKGLQVLLEVHTKEEFVKACATKADLIGINNRDLDTLIVDIATTEHILSSFEKERVIVAESGIETPEDVRHLRDAGAQAFLVGSSIMQSDDIEKQVQALATAY